jgi:hypothetical protein
MKKQTAVEWLEKEIESLSIQVFDGFITFIEFMEQREQLFKKAKEMEKQKDAKYNEMLETLEIVSKKLNGNGFPSLQNKIEKVIKDVKFKQQIT